MTILISFLLLDIIKFSIQVRDSRTNKQTSHRTSPWRPEIPDSRGYYDPALVKRLLPMLKEYNVNAFLQGHRHTVDHSQEATQEPGKGLHFFTIGAGALLNSSSAVAQVLGRDEPRNACFADGNVNDEARCYFYWAPIQKTGAYAYMTTEPSGVTVEFIESAYDRVMYKTVLPPRK